VAVTGEGTDKHAAKEKEVPKRTWRTVLREKTWWDWLQILIIPVVLVLLGFILNAAQSLVQSAAEAESRRWMKTGFTGEASPHVFAVGTSARQPYGLYGKKCRRMKKRTMVVSAIKAMLKAPITTNQNTQPLPPKAELTFFATARNFGSDAIFGSRPATPVSAHILSSFWVQDRCKVSHISLRACADRLATFRT
jgi:hypothetical protein